ncbi:MAG: RNA polymerase sigma factor [Gemmatimonadaceae bacterium]
MTIPLAPRARPACGDDLSQAIEEVCARFGALVRHAGRRHGLDPEVLDEVAQEVRIRLWRSLGTCEKIRGAPASYVYRTAVSAALDLLRRKRARGGIASADGAARLDGLSDGARLPGDTLDDEELSRQVSQAVERLPLARRVAVRMHLAGYDRDEMAALAGWTEAKTRNLLYRGLADLRELLASSPIATEVRWHTGRVGELVAPADARRRAVRVASHASVREAAASNARRTSGSSCSTC